MQCSSCGKQTDGKAADILPLDQRTKEVYITQGFGRPLRATKPDQLCADCVKGVQRYLDEKDEVFQKLKSEGKVQ